MGLAELGRGRDRCRALCKLALNKGIGGSLTGPSSYLMKSPAEQVPDPVARELTEQFIEENALEKVSAVAAEARRARR